MDAGAAIDLRLAALHRDRLGRTGLRTFAAANAGESIQLRERGHDPPRDKVGDLPGQAVSEHMEEYIGLCGNRFKIRNGKSFWISIHG